MRYLTEKLLLDKDFPFEIYYGGGKNDNEDTFYLHNHHCLEINFCLEGEGKYIISDTEYPILKNDIFIINNLEYHMAKKVSDNLQLMVIVFDPELILSGSNDYQYIRAFYEWKIGFKHRLPSDIFATKEITEILSKIQDEWKLQKVGCKLVVKSLLLMLLALLYRKFENIEGISKKIRDFYKGYIKLVPAINYMEKNFKKDIPLSVLAQEASMSENYFSSFFSQNMNCTVIEYLVRLRIKNACSLLSSTDNSILSIALESGFENLSYFNRVFKKQLGITPREYRKRN